MAQQPFIYVKGEPLSASGFDAYFSFPGVPAPAASDVIDIVRPANIIPTTPPVGIAKASTQATSDTTFLIEKNGSKIGEILFSAGSLDGSLQFDSSTSISFVYGDSLEVVAPDPMDSTLENIRVAILLR